MILEEFCDETKEHTDDGWWESELIPPHPNKEIETNTQKGSRCNRPEKGRCYSSLERTWSGLIAHTESGFPQI